MNPGALFGPLLSAYASPTAGKISTLSRALQLQFEYFFWQIGTNFERAVFLLAYQGYYGDGASQRVVKGSDSQVRNSQIFTSFVVETFKALSISGPELLEQKLPAVVSYNGGPLEGAYLNPDEVDSAISYLILLLASNLFGKINGGLFGSLVCSGVIRDRAKDFMRICTEIVASSSRASSEPISLLDRFSSPRLMWRTIVPIVTKDELNKVYPHKFFLESDKAMSIEEVYTQLSRTQSPLQSRLMQYDKVFTEHFRLAHLRTRLNDSVDRWLHLPANPKEAEEFELHVEYANFENKLHEFYTEMDYKVDPSSTGSVTQADRIAITQAVNNLIAKYRGNYSGKARLMEYLAGQMRASVREPTSNHILVVGEPGTGKTSMIEEVATIMMLARLILPPSLVQSLDLAHIVYTLMDTDSRDTYTNIARGMGFLPKKDAGDDDDDDDDDNDDDGDEKKKRKGKKKKTKKKAQTGRFTGEPESLSTLGGSRAIELRQAQIVLASLSQVSVPVIIEPSNLIGQFQGQTNYHTVHAIYRTLGSMLIVDEAYQLLQQPHELPGTLGQINTFITKLGKHWGTALVGYQEEIIQTLRMANPGLESRYATTILFPSFKPRELSAILGDRVNSTDSLPQFYYGMTLGDFMALSDEDLDTNLVIYLSRINRVMLGYGSRHYGRIQNNVFGSSNARSVRNMATKSYSQLTYGGSPITEQALGLGRVHLIPVSRFAETMTTAHKNSAPFDRLKRKPQFSSNAGSVSAAQSGYSSDETDQELMQRLKFTPANGYDVLRDTKKRELQTFLATANIVNEQQLLEQRLYAACGNFVLAHPTHAVTIGWIVHSFVVTCYPDVVIYYDNIRSEYRDALAYLRRAEQNVFMVFVMAACKHLDKLLSDVVTARELETVPPHHISNFIVFGIPYQIALGIIEQRPEELEFESTIPAVRFYDRVQYSSTASDGARKRPYEPPSTPLTVEKLPVTKPLPSLFSPAPLSQTLPALVPPSSLFSPVPSVRPQPQPSPAPPPTVSTATPPASDNPPDTGDFDLGADF